MYRHARYRDGTWYLVDPDGERTLGPAFEDELPASLHAYSDKEVRQRLQDWIEPAGRIPPDFSNRGFHRPLPGDQGKRNTCASFAINAAIEGRLARARNRQLLSAQYTNAVLMAGVKPARTWCSDSLPIYAAAEILARERVCTEAWCAYQSKRGDWCQRPPPADAKLNARYGIVDWFPIEREVLANPDLLMRLVYAGLDIVISVNAGAFGDLHPQGDRIHHVHPADVAPLPGTPPGPGGHAMVIVAYDTMGPVPHFECYDSLGMSARWSHGGYVRLSHEFLRIHGRYGLVVTQVAG